MSEKTYNHPKHEHQHSDAELQDHDKERLDELVAERARNAKHEHAEKLEDIREEAAKEALGTTDLLAKQVEAEPAPTSTFINSDLKDMKYKRTLQSVRKDLSKPERALSKVVHNPAVDAISTAAEKTIARPSGLLAGSFFAFLGSSVFLWVSKHYGYSYNFLLFALFFAAGFALGLLIELVFRLFKKSPRQ